VTAGTEWPHIVLLEPFNAGLALARRMTALGARVTVVLQPGHTLIGRSRGVESIVVPCEPAGEPWLETLQRLAGRGEEIAVLPASDRACEFLVHALPKLPDNVLAFERLDGAHLKLMDKHEADAIATRAGVRVPWTMPVGDPQQLAAAAEVAPWPCVIKPVLSHEWRERYGQERVFLVADADEAAELLARPFADGFPMLLMQYVPGGDEQLEEATVVRLADGSYPVRWGCRKLRQYPPGFGATTVAESAPVPEAMEIAERVLDEAGFVGVANVETKRHADTGENWFLEVNVRLPGHWGLGDACGVQCSQRLLAALLGRPLGPQPPLRAGVRVVFPELDKRVVGPMLAGAPAWRRPALAWRLAQSYRGTRELGMFDPRDPGPALALAGDFTRRRLAGLAARVQKSP
jgi:D-aspartate ligase